MHTWLKKISLLLTLLVFSVVSSFAQCSICTKTAQQLGEEPAKGLNFGIIYLMIAPLAIAGFITFRWLKVHKS